MKTLKVFDRKDYNANSPVFFREAVRAVIMQNGTVAMAKSEAEGFYKFPGGGIEPGENHEQTLVREVREETGLSVCEGSIKALGAVHERRKSQQSDGEIFEQVSYYYFAGVRGVLLAQNLDDYEKELGFALEWVPIEKALEANLRIGSHPKWGEMVRREAWVLGFLFELSGANTIEKTTGQEVPNCDAKRAESENAESFETACKPL